MKEILFTGSGVAIVTPFHAGAVNFPAFGRLIDRQIDGGTDAIIVCGTTGEAATMTQKERMETIAYCVDRVAGRVPVIAGTGANDTQVARENALAAERLGVDGLLIVTPYYNKSTQEGLVAHYTEIAEKTTLPIVVYNVPSRTGVNIQPVAFLVIKDGCVRTIQLSDTSNTIDRALTMLPELVDKLAALIKRDEKAPEAAPVEK